MNAAPLLLVISILSACGDDQLRPMPLDAYPAAAIDALCTWAVRCRYELDDATCRRFVDPRRYDLRRARDEMAAGRLVYDPEQAARCLREGALGSCVVTPFTQDACRGVFAGQVAEGGGCIGSYDCAGGATCEARSCAAGCCLGRCGAPPAPDPTPVGPGGPCERHSDCVPEAYCELDNTCRAQPDFEGARCLFGCTWGDLYCDIDTLTCRRFAELDAPCDLRRCNPNYAFCDAGVCRRRPELGEACDPSGASDQLCVPSAWCDPAGGRCLVPQAPGAGCTGDTQCAYACDPAAHTCLDYRTCAVPPAKTGPAAATLLPWR